MAKILYRREDSVFFEIFDSKRLLGPLELDL